MIYKYDNVLEGETIYVVELEDNNFKLQGHGFDFLLPKNVSEYLVKLKSSENLKFSDDEPLLADFSVEVDKDITHYKLDKLIYGLETSIRGLVDVSDYRFLLSFTTINIHFFNDYKEFDSIEITSSVPDFQSSNDDWISGDDRLQRLYEAVAGLAENEEVDDSYATY